MLNYQKLCHKGHRSGRSLSWITAILIKALVSMYTVSAPGYRESKPGKNRSSLVASGSG